MINQNELNLGSLVNVIIDDVAHLATITELNKTTCKAHVFNQNMELAFIYENLFGVNLTPQMLAKMGFVLIYNGTQQVGTINTTYVMGELVLHRHGEMWLAESKAYSSEVRKVHELQAFAAHNTSEALKYSKN